jgi:1-acyl-sn-glycerol-3-phosphate acyltransferase
MRAKIHPPVYTKGLTLENKNTVKHQVRELILTDLENDLT